MKQAVVFLSIFFSLQSFSQHAPDAVYSQSIKTAKLFLQNNQLSMPIINLNSFDLMELHFDDMDAYAKNYFYTFQLCNADWSVADINPFDYLKGFTQNRITQYRPSSIALVKYMHYQAILPEKNCVPTKSGNYLLKVFLNSDTNQLAFVKRFFVVESKTAIGAQLLQPFNANQFKTHQKIQFSINTQKLNVFNPQQQVKVLLMQNNRWDNARFISRPAFIRNNQLEYDGEADGIFSAAKEYRWIDLRSFRFQSDRIEKASINATNTDVILKADGNRVNERYLYYRDFNGFYEIVTTDLVNNWWQSDYAKVKFTYVPNNNQPFAGQDVFVLGELTQNTLSQAGRMEYNATKGVYEKEFLLKQGIYSYMYVTKPKNGALNTAQTSQTEGDYWETENVYNILVYFRSFNGRHDELLGFTTVNTGVRREGF